jgi:DNA polymerase-3 subunit delta'
MADAFDTILGQAQVRDFLRASVVSERVTHAYLFLGPCGSNKTQAAYALARALVCPQGARGPRGGKCGGCDACRRVSRRVHPDVKYFEPEGANGYLIEQARELMADVALAPISAPCKVYIIDRVDLLGTSCANAILKTLEEPPKNVVFILLGRTRESVLPTISSRCQIVPFRHIPPSEAAGIVAQHTGADAQLALQAIDACAGSMTGAISFLNSNERLEFRRWLIRGILSTPRRDAWDLLTFAKEIAERSKAPLDNVRQRLEMEISENADFLAKSAVRQIEAKHKRQLTQKTREFLRQTAAIISSVLRDVMLVCAGVEHLVVNADFAPEIQAFAQLTNVAALEGALCGVREAQDALAYNVSPETCLDKMLLNIKECLHDTRNTC